MAEQRAPSTGVVRYQRPALIVGVLGLAASAIGWFIDPQEFFRGYLPSYVFWFSIVAGALAVLMLQYTTGGEWGLMIRRPLGAAARTMLWMLLFFIPIVIGMKYLYPWMDLDWARRDEVVSQKLAYLNWKRFGVFTLVYFGAWILWAWRIRALSVQFYKDRSPYTDLSRRRWAAAGLPMIVLTLTFASIDWMMSLEPKWNSTMYGITFVVGCGLSAFAVVTFFLSRLATTDAMKGILKPTHLPRPRQPDAGVRDVLRLHDVLGVPSHLVREPARGDPALRHSRAGRVGCDRDHDHPLPLLPAVFHAADAADQRPSGNDQRRYGDHHRDALRRDLLVDRAFVVRHTSTIRSGV